MSAVVKCIQIAPYGRDKVQVSKGKSSAMENKGCVRQDFDTGSKPGDPGDWRWCCKWFGQETGDIKKMKMKRTDILYISFSYLSIYNTNVVPLSQRIKNAHGATCSPISELSTPQRWVPHHPYIVMVNKQLVDVNGFHPCYSGAHFLSLAPGWEHTMTNTTHISSLAGSQADRQGDTGVICFCQKHRNSFPTPPGVDKAGRHSLACHQGGMCSCCDYLRL